MTLFHCLFSTLKEYKRIHEFAMFCLKKHNIIKAEIHQDIIRQWHGNFQFETFFSEHFLLVKQTSFSNFFFIHQLLCEFMMKKGLHLKTFISIYNTSCYLQIEQVNQLVLFHIDGYLKGLDKALLMLSLLNLLMKFPFLNHVKQQFCYLLHQ